MLQIRQFARFISIRRSVCNLKKKLFAKVCAAAVAASCLAGSISVSQLAIADAETRFEFEDGDHANSIVPDESSERWMDGASGDKFVFLESANDTVSVKVDVEKTAVYDVYICYSAPYGAKKNYVYVNGVDQGLTDFSSKAWTEKKVATVKLGAGENEVSVVGSWGWTNYDYVRVEEATLPEVKAINTKCSDKNATESTQRVMKFLADNYGNHIISGQQEFYGTSREDEFTYIKNLTDNTPVIRGFDFGETCPLFYWDAQTADRAIDWVNNKGGIATASWHVNVPKKMSNYTLGSTMAFDQTTYSEKTDFVTANVLKEGTTEHDYFLLAVDNLAKALKKCADADVPILFRPFHEAEGNGGKDGSGAWFWWSKEGADVYVELYQYLYTLLTEEYGLHNLIWEFNSYVYSDDSALWYPGDEYVDIIGYDKYNASTAPNESAISSIFYGLIDMYKSSKLVALMECDTIPSIDNMLDEGAYWLYFCVWYDSPGYEFISGSKYQNAETVKKIYQSDSVITLEKLTTPLKEYPLEDTDPTDPTEPDVTDPTEVTPTDVDPTEPDSTDSTEVVPTDVDPTEPDSTEVVPTDVDPTEPDPTDSTNSVKVPDGAVASMYGDVNTDGEISISDVVALNMFLLNSAENSLTDVQMANADCVKNGIVDTSDSSLLINYIAMIITSDQLGQE